MLDIVMNFIQGILDMGAAVMLPIVICLLGLFFRMKIGAAIKAGLLVGIGFQGLNLVVSFMMTTVDPVVSYYQEQGTGYSVVDIGFAAVGGASWTVPFAVFVIPVALLINFILIKLKVTNVLNVDIWNFIHFLIPGAMAYALSGSVILGFTVSVILSVVVLFVGKIIAPVWQERFGLEGTTCTTLNLIAMTYPTAWVVDKIIDKIPGLKKLDVNFEKLGKRFGTFGDPAFIGLIVGLILGIITRQDISSVITIGVGMSAVMILMPRMVSIMMEGITPIGNAASKYIKKKLGDDSDIYIGMDVALGLGEPECITLTALMIPATILLSFLVPNISYFPLGLLTSVCYLTPMCVMACKGNMFRAFVAGCVGLYLCMLFENIFVPEATAMMQATGVEISGMITDCQFGINPGSILVALIHRIISFF